MGFRTPSEIHRELDSFDQQKKRMTEAAEKRFGKKTRPAEVLEKPEPLPRILAFLIDQVIAGIVFSIPLLLFGLFVAKLIENNFSEISFPLANIAYLLFVAVLTTLWYGFFHSQYGATPGKMLFHLELRDDFDESRTSFARAFFREFLGKAISASLFMIGFLLGLLNQEKRCLHDYLTGTKVVRVHRQTQEEAQD